MEIRPVLKVIQRLENVRNSSNGYSARCPGHDDTNNSLSIAEGMDGRALVYCFAGCSFDEIVNSMGLTESDLFDPLPDSNSKDIAKSKKMVAVYDYVDEEGQLLFQSVRFVPKSFAQRRPDGKGRWIYKLNGVKYVPYCLPDILRTKASPYEPIIIVEGEKDVATVNRLGFTGTCNPMGAGNWKADYNEYFRGKYVLIIPDNDSTGIKHAQHVHSNLTGITASVVIARLPAFYNGKQIKDITDWYKAGGTSDELKELLDAAIRCTPLSRPREGVF